MTVLLAYDGKPYTEKALDYSIEYALAFETTLYIMSSVVSKSPEEQEVELNHIKIYLDEAKHKASEKGVDVRTIIGAGSPGEEILAAAERIDADAIIVGRTDKTAMDRVLWGTVSEHVLRSAHRIVIVVQ